MSTLCTHEKIKLNEALENVVIFTKSNIYHAKSTDNKDFYLLNVWTDKIKCQSFTSNAIWTWSMISEYQSTYI